jgi:hypothetical protein
VAARQPDVAAHLLLDRQREELLRRGQHPVEERLVDTRPADVEEPDVARRGTEFGGHPFALGGVGGSQPADVDDRY